MGLKSMGVCYLCQSWFTSKYTLIPSWNQSLTMPSSLPLLGSIRVLARSWCHSQVSLVLVLSSMLEHHPCCSWVCLLSSPVVGVAHGPGQRLIGRWCHSQDGLVYALILVTYVSWLGWSMCPFVTLLHQVGLIVPVLLVYWLDLLGFDFRKIPASHSLK